MPRRLKQPQYKRFRFSKRIKHDGPKLSSGWKLFRGSLELLKQNWRLFGGVLLVYGLLTILFVRGFASTVNLNGVDSSNSFSVFSSLIGTSGGGGSQSSSVYQTILLVITSLALIWALRQVSDGNTQAIKVKDTFYKSMTPLVPFILVLAVITLQLLPMALGASIYGLVVNNGLAVSALERAIWFAVFLLFATWTLYMLSSSIFAAYIVTLPGMTPRRALKSAKKLVMYRRWTLVRKILFLPIIIMIAMAVVTIPVIMVFAPAAEWVAFALGIITLAVVHAYFYGLYKEML